jgi:hypothetical protein
MTCPRCGSKSVHQSHETVACLACGHIINERPPEPILGLASLLAPAYVPPKPGDNETTRQRHR